MSPDKELEIQMQFLEEATDYLNTLEAVLLEIDASKRVDLERINAAMRSAHSIKGGAGMMGFRALSDLAHRLEDSFKVLKTRKNSLEIETKLQSLLLSSVDWLRQIVEIHSQREALDDNWLQTFCYPVFDELHERLGDPAPEDASTMFSPEDGLDIIPMLFETEVEGCLQRLEGVLADSQQPCLREEVSIMAAELGGLGEMLQLSAFTRLCESTIQCLSIYPDRVVDVANAALATWRRSQALVLTNQLDQLPTELDLGAASTSSGATTNFNAQPEFAYTEEVDLAIAEFLATSEPEITYTESTESAIAEFLATSREEITPSSSKELDKSEFFALSEEKEEIEIPESAIARFLATDSEQSQEVTEAIAEFLLTDRSQPQEVTEAIAEFLLTSGASAANSLEPAVFDSDTWDESEFIATNYEAMEAALEEDDSVAEFEISQPAASERGEISATDFGIFTEAKESNFASLKNESAENTVRVSSKQLETINDLFGELIIQRNGLNLQLERLRRLVRTLNQRVQILDRENQQLRAAYDKIATTAAVSPVPSLMHLTGGNNNDDPSNENGGHSSGFDTLEMDRYNELNSLSQEVMETIVMVQEVTTDVQLSLDDTDQISRKFNKTSKQLQNKLTQVRMRPISDIVDRFPRALRDLSVEYGKNVQLKVEGSNTLIERSILEALNEPLMHLLRNAFDHGIEDPIERRANGKPEQALIEIKAMHRSNRTVITMRDDGRGISLDKIRAKALGMGLDEQLLSMASDEELLSLIFEPGFSTCDLVTSLSGRGVGMDVVRNNLKQVRGDVKVDTIPGLGTTFTLSVPFTLSVARVLLIESNRMLLAFPTDVVSEIFLLQDEMVSLMNGSEVLYWQSTTLPLIRLGRYLDFNCPRYDNPELETPPAINATSVLIINQGNQPVGVQVDRCWGEQEVAIRRVEGNLPLPDGFNNCTILGDGRVVALVNTNELLYWIATNERTPKTQQLPSTRLKTAFLKPSDQKPASSSRFQKGTILIVDDSINVRRFLALTLEKGGYQVEQAKDGQDALEKLQTGLRPHAVICDIEMPRLDGYGFLGRVKANTDLKKIPVAMLTSRSSEKHRQLAVQLGAIAYFSKPYNEQDLLRSLSEIVSSAA